MRNLLTLPLCLLLAGCAGKTIVEQREEALAAYQTPIFTHQIPKTELRNFEQEYRQAADSQFSEISAAARQRLADLALEDSEKHLLQYNFDGSGSDSNAGYHKAIKIYRQLLEDYPDRAMNDTVRYQLARAYDYAGEPLATLATLTSLVELHPQSPFYSEAQLRRGEQLFSLGRFSKASKAYQAVIEEGEEGIFYKHALYKYAWSVYREGRYSAAHHAFADVLDYLQTPAEMDQLRVGDQELVKDVLRIMAISFSQQKGAESIKAFADSRSTPIYTPLFYQTLAQQFATQRLYSQAAEVYLYYSDNYTDSPRAPMFYLEAISMYNKARMPDKILASREAFVTRYGVAKPVWQLLSTELLTKVKPKLKENLLFLAKHHHANYQTNGQLAELNKAQVWYERLIKNFPSDQDSGEIHLLYAESLFEEKQYQQAAEAYQQAAYHYPAHEKSAEAGYAVLLSQQLNTSLTEDQLANKLVVSTGLFLEHFLNDERANEVRHLKADQHIVLKDYPAAIQELDLAMSAQPVPSSSLKAILLGKLSLSHFILGNFVESEQKTEMALRHEVDVASRKLLKERYAASIYKQAEHFKGEGDHGQAAEHFLRIAQLIPSATIIAQAEYDGATAYIAQSRWQAAVEVLERFVIRFSQHSLNMGAREKLAYLYGELGQHGKAANSYEQLATLETDIERKRVWLSQSADLYQKSESFSQAIRMLGSYISLLDGRSMERYEVMLRVANLEKNLGNTNKYRSKLMEINKSISPSEADLGIRQQGADAALTLAKSYHEEFAGIEISHPIKSSIAKKNRAMKQAMELYMQADEYRISSVTTAATFYIGELYSQLSHSLLKAPMPNELDADEKEMYLVMLEEQAYPFEEKSIALHLVNVERINKGIYDQWVKQSFEALSKLQPGRYDKQEKVKSVIAALN